MNEIRVCPSCQEDIEDGAAYCGNCGFKLTDKPTTTQQVYSNGPATSDNLELSTPLSAGANVPAYSVPHSHHKQHWGAMALAFGILGVGAGILIPILGIALGIVGVILITSSYHITHKSLKLASVIASMVAILVGLGFWVNAINHNPKVHQTSAQTGTSNGVATVSLTTPCYSVSFNTELNVNNDSGSCSMNAYNGPNFDSSSNVFKVVASNVTGVSSANFAGIAKQSIEQDVAKNLPAFSVTNEDSNIFSGSPAYYVQAYDSSSNIAVIEEAILHNSKSGKDNFFVIVHATGGQSVNLNNLQSSWAWND